MKHFGEAKMSLCLQIIRNLNKEAFFKSLIKSAERLLQRLGFDVSHPVSTAIEYFRDPARLTGNSDTENAPVDSILYCEKIGSLIYSLIGTCPEIVFSVKKLSRFLKSLLEKRWIMVKRLMRYINGTKHFALRYSKNSNIIPCSFSVSG